MSTQNQTLTRSRKALLKEVRKTAFASWLLAQPAEEATLHFLLCLSKGAHPNEAWKIFEAVYGDRTFGPGEIRPAITSAINLLRRVA